MAVTSIGEIIEARKGKNDKGVRSYSRQFLIQIDNESDNIFTVTAPPALPLVGHQYPLDPQALCKSVNAECKTALSWTYTAEYDTVQDDVQETDENDNKPWNAFPIITWSSEIYQEAIYKDKDGEAIVNSAGDYFVDPAPTRDASHLIAQIKQKVQFVPSWVFSYQNAVNSGPITIDGLSVGTGLAKVQRISIGETQTNGFFHYREVTLEIHLHKDGWKLEPLDAGFRKLVDGKPVKVEGATQPVLLDLAGDVLENPEDPSQAKYHEFKIYPELNFSSLPGVS